MKQNPARQIHSSKQPEILQVNANAEQSIAWESEVWIAEAPNTMNHFNGERFLGPYADVMPAKS